MSSHAKNLGTGMRRRHRPGITPETLVGLVRRGVDSLERLRELIAISPTDEAELRKTFHPNLVRHHVRHRAQILHFFDPELANPHPAPVCIAELAVPVRKWPKLRTPRQWISRAFSRRPFQPSAKKGPK